MSIQNIPSLLSRYFQQRFSSFAQQHLDASIFTETEQHSVQQAILQATAIDSPVMERVVEDISAFLDNDPALKGKKDTREVLLYPSLTARFFYQIAHTFYLQGQTVVARAISEGARRLTSIEIHPGANIGKRLTIDHGTGVVIGETAEVWDDVTMFHGVTLGGTGKDTGKRHPTVWNMVFIGANAQLIGPITIGNNVKIWANSTVIHDVPDFATITGVKAQLRKLHGKSL